MPTSLMQDLITKVQDAQSTHNVVTSNAAAMLAIRLAPRYLVRNTVSSPACAASSASSSSALSAKTAQMRMNHVRKRYEGRVHSSKLDTSTKVWLRKTLDSNTMSKELDYVTLVEEHDGRRVTTSWYLPLQKIYTIVLSALIDKDEECWPVPLGSTVKKERLLRLQAFDLTNNALAHSKIPVCNTGIRHAWLMALDGYEGKRLPLNAEDVLMQGLFDFMMQEVLGKQMNIGLPDGRDPVGKERIPLHEHFQSLFLPWIKGPMPEIVLDAISKAGGEDAARKFVLERFRTIGIAPDKLMMQKINGYCSEEGLKTIPCTFIPILATLEGYARRQTLAESSCCIAGTGILPLTQDTLVWLQGSVFSPQSLANPEAATDPFSIMYLVLRLLDALYHYKDYKKLLDVSDMKGGHQEAWGDALHFLRQCLHNPDLTLMPLLEDPTLLEQRLCAFERGYGVWRNSAYHDFISNYAANWFAASGDDGIFTRATLFETLCELFFQENNPENERAPAIQVHDAMLIEWIEKAGQDGILDVTPYQINRIFLHALCYPEDSWSYLFHQCLPTLIRFIRNRCNQAQNMAGDKLSRDSWPEALLAQIEYLATPEPTGEPPVPVMFTPGNITPLSSLEIAKLLAASSDGSESIVQKIVQHPGFDPNATNSEGLTPFYLAAGFGNTRFAGALLEKGASYTVIYRNNFTPLHLAIYKQLTHFVQWFLQTRPKHERFSLLMTKDSFDNSILHRMAVMRPEILKLLLECLPKTERVSMLMVKSQFGNTLLYLAVRESPNILKQLLDCLPKAERANLVMTKNDNGFSLLQWVATSHLEHLKQLLECLPESTRAEAMMMRNGDGFTVMHQILGCNPKILKQVLDCLPEAAKVEVLMAKDSCGYSVLHHAQYYPEYQPLLRMALPQLELATTSLSNAELIRTNHETDYALSPTTSSSATDVSSSRSAYSFFREAGTAQQDQGSPDDQSKQSSNDVLEISASPKTI
ncbi:ankyrin repeat domain-containing protein [Legionella worsleiensis]|uniref:Ankyrin repeats (3 copies) n=1 Tax=Legionella worsleiensis TaxID=45076 RepID=A0A0W1AJ37_9GAMM|nr:ankyrin repeat domain-containing protein [Legionella worsleiensis]KTD81391.1 Ankyrin repeats (3 copies) [Legionella worsleiensis]STY30036.1 Ankyrin repeats (3 copies) [Legionella worsleiensis]